MESEQPALVLSHVAPLKLVSFMAGLRATHFHFVGKPGCHGDVEAQVEVRLQAFGRGGGGGGG